MKKGRILYTKKDGICFLKLVGDITCTNILGFDLFIEQLARETTINEVLIDLCFTKYVDSTNLGLLAEIARLMRIKGYSKPTILSTNERISELIENMGFDKVFAIINMQGRNIDEFKEIPEIEQDDNQKAQMILKAHKNIMAISEKNEFLFKDVVELLENQIKKNNLG